MRGILTLLFCLCSFIASATDYYVSSTGNDSADGLSSSTPWKTISKVNSEFSRINPGDRILFRRGDVFYGTVTVAKSGTAGSPIIIGSYGTGALPRISGFTAITGWTNAGGGVYSKAVSCESVSNMLLLDGVNKAKGRWPNSGWLTIDSHNGSTSLTDSELPASPDWTGGEVIVRTYASLVDRSTISDHNGNSLTYTPLTQDPINGVGYFIQNHRGTLDNYGEWCYTNGTLYMFFGSESPENHEVKLATRNKLIVMLGKPYITIEYIHFEGANEDAIYNDLSDYVTVKNCIIENNGQNGIKAEANSDHQIIENNTITNNNNIGIFFRGNTSVGNIVKNNNVRYSGYLLGMGMSGFHGYTGIINDGTNSLTTYNNIEYTGYIAIRFGGQNCEVSYNFINYCNLCKDDGAGIYSWRDHTTGKVIKSNIILNCLARPDGWYYVEVVRSHGIYLDGLSNALVTNNTAAGNDGCGIFINSAQNVTAEYNTCYDNIWGIRILSEAGSLARNHRINSNILVAKELVDPSNVWNQSAFGVVSKLDAADLSQFGTSDYNFFARPVNNDNYIEVWKNAWGWAPGDRMAYNLSEWQSLFGKDSHSSTTSVTVSDPDKIRFEYNASTSSKVVSLDGSYVDVKGAKYNGSITLAPYTSAVLMVDPNPSAPPAVPVYSSAAVQDGAPSIVEMTYSLALANIVPAASAFTVQVNSTARTVSSVSVSGTKVLLTLSSPVAYGNTVTVAYTKPSANPLQTSAGGQAATISAQSVTNRVAAPAAPAVPAYVSSEIKDAARSVVEMTYSLSLANIVPAASAFTVQVNSTARTVSSVSVSGTKVLLTLSSPVAYGNTVTVAYTKPSANPLQTSAGGQAATISAQSVTNRIAAPAAPAVPAYVSSEIKDAARSVIEMTYNLSLANIVPAASAFTVQVNSTARSVSSVSVSGTKVLLTLSSPVAYGNTVTVAYTKPSTSPLQTSAGGQAATISAQSVTNRIAAPPAPAVPVYVSSVIENAAPSVIEITYNLALASKVPAGSAFTVQVNSTARSVSSVSVSGTKVLLTLSSPVAYGNTVTVAYTKPSTNPIQTAAGGQASTISAQSVTNRVSQPAPPPVVVIPPPVVPNTQPVPVIKFQEKTYSGFIGEIDARGSYDTDKDKLSFSWKVPAEIPVSGTNTEVIQFLAPLTETSQTYEFILTVSDGKTTQSKTIPITVVPYEPDLEIAEVISVKASDSYSNNLPYNIIDGNIGTMWSSKGEEQSLILELKSPFIIQHIKIAFQPGQKMECYFDIYGSNDGENWESILVKAKSCSFSGGIHVFEFPISKAITEYRYLKFVGLGNSVDSWNYISEFRIFGYRHKNRADYEDLIVKLYPNPAREIVNIKIDDAEFNPDFIKILTLDGKVMYSNIVDPMVRDFQVPVNFTHGIYIVQMGMGNITMFTQKLIVFR